MAQRYHQGLNQILNQPHKRLLPDKFNYFHQLFEKSIESVYFTDIQFTNGTHVNSQFIKLGLLFKKEKEVKWGNSGLKLEFKDSVNGREYPIYVNFYEDVPLNAYDNKFTPKEYNPYDFEKKMEYGMRIQSLTEPQALANIINIFGISSPDKTAFRYIIDDISKRSEVKLNVDENSPDAFTHLLNQIYAVTKNYPHNFLYSLYIKDSDPKKNLKNLNLFFRSYTPSNISDIIDDYASMKAEFQVERQKVFLNLPKEFIRFQQENSQIKHPDFLSLNIGEAQLKVFQGVDIESHIKIHFNYIYPTKESFLFEIPNEIKLNPSVISDKNRTLRAFNTKDVKEVKLKIFEKETEISLVFQHEEIKIGRVKNK